MEKSLIEGMPSAEITAAAAKKFTITVRQAQYDLREIHQRWAKAGEEIRLRYEAMASLALALRRREHLYRSALQNGERRNALDAEIDRCRLLNLYPKTEVKVEGDVSVGGDVKVDVMHEHRHTIVSRIQEYASIYDRLVSDQAPLSGSANGNGVHEQVHNP